MIKLYHIPRQGDPYGGSRNSTKVLIALEEAGIDHEIVPVSREGDCQRPGSELRRLNPNGTSPTIEQAGFVLWESGAILQYLADLKPGSGLLPEGTEARAQALQWLFWESATLMPALLGLFGAMVAETPDEGTTAQAKARFEGILAILNDALANRDYVAVDYSIADIALGNAIPVAFNLGQDLGRFPHVASWLERLAQRPAWAGAETFTGDMAARQT